MKYIKLFMISLLLTYNHIDAHKEWVHQYIVRQAYLLLENELGTLPQEFSDMFIDSNGNFYPYGEPDYPFANAIIGGSWVEDLYDPVYSYCGHGLAYFLLGCYLASNSHFWVPDNSDVYHSVTLEYVSGT